MSGFKQGHKVGASKSLNRTITEIMEFLGHKDRPKGKKLREILEEKIGDLAANWFKKGFNRGHKESHKHFETDGLVPQVLEYEGSRKLSPNQDRAIKLKSKIKKEPKAKAKIAKSESRKKIK